MIHAQISRGEAPKTWDATVSFDSEDAAYRAANYVRAFLLVRAAPPAPSLPAPLFDREGGEGMGDRGKERASSAKPCRCYSFISCPRRDD